MRNIILNGNKIDIDCGFYSGHELKKLVDVKSAKLYLDIDDELDIPINDSDYMIIEGGERFVTGNSQLPTNPCLRTPVNVDINGTSFCINSAKITGIDLKDLSPSIPKQESVFLDIQGMPDELLKDDQVLILRSGLSFLTVPCGNVGEGLQNLVLSEHFSQLKSQYPSATITKEAGQYLITIPRFKLPNHWSENECEILIVVPNAYPSAPLDMFYVLPHILRKGGGIPSRSEARQNFLGKSWQRFSWHYDSRPWDPNKDSISSHIRFCLQRLNIDE